MKPYSILTVRGQARRLRSLSWKALQQYALNVASLRLVTNDINGIFRVDTTEGRKLILRAALQAGYTHCYPWPDRHPGEIDSFIAARGFGLANFILNNPKRVAEYKPWRNNNGNLFRGLF